LYRSGVGVSWRAEGRPADRPLRFPGVFFADGDFFAAVGGSGAAINKAARVSRNVIEPNFI